VAAVEVEEQEEEEEEMRRSRRGGRARLLNYLPDDWRNVTCE